MLPPYLRIIQGDGISYESLGDIMENMKKNKWSVDNIAFGSGGKRLVRVRYDCPSTISHCYSVISMMKGNYKLKLFCLN